MWEKWGEEIIGQGCQESLYQELTLEPRTEKRWEESDGIRVGRSSCTMEELD